jgi:hypothetical protein
VKPAFDRTPTTSGAREHGSIYYVCIWDKVSLHQRVLL